MPKLTYQPVLHDHVVFIAEAKQQEGFKEAYAALSPEYALLRQMLEARTRAGLTQEAVAAKMGTTKSAVSRLEAGGKHTPSLATLRKYALAVGCELAIRLVPESAKSQRRKV